MDVVQATTGMDGLLEIGRVNPDLVILDYALPDLNAVQVVERLQNRLPGPVMIVTGGLPAAAENELRRLGVRSIINKVDGIALSDVSYTRPRQGLCVVYPAPASGVAMPACQKD